MNEEEQKMYALLIDWLPSNEYQLVAIVEFMYQFDFCQYAWIDLSEMKEKSLKLACNLLPGCHDFIIDELNRREEEEKEHDQMILDIQNIY
jgi:hypothetical protein